MTVLVKFSVKAQSTDKLLPEAERQRRHFIITCYLYYLRGNDDLGEFLIDGVNEIRR
jgi:hypothetical protein